MKLLANIEPSWVVSDGWLTLSLSSAHLEQILDAQRGLIPTLGAVPDVRALGRRSGERTVFAVLQPDLATEVVQRWLDAHRRGSPSLLDPTWWQLDQGNRRQAELQGRGFLAVEAKELGVLVVEEIDPGGPAAPALEVGDWILGVDGVLLSLSAPAADFEARWVSSHAEPGPSLRIHRGDVARDVVVARVPRPTEPAEDRFDPVDLLRELVALGRALQFVSFEAHASDEVHYSARVSVRFAPAQLSNAETDTPDRTNAER
jgi:hypothetical protein